MQNIIKRPFTSDWKNIDNCPKDLCFFLQDVAEDFFINFSSSVIQQIYLRLSGDVELLFRFEQRKKVEWNLKCLKMKTSTITVKNS